MLFSSLKEKQCLLLQVPKHGGEKQAERFHLIIPSGFHIYFLLLSPRLEPINQVSELANCLSQVHGSEQEQVLMGAGAATDEQRDKRATAALRDR